VVRLELAFQVHFPALAQLFLSPQGAGTGGHRRNVVRKLLPLAPGVPDIALEGQGHARNRQAAGQVAQLRITRGAPGEHDAVHPGSAQAALALVRHLGRACRTITVAIPVSAPSATVAVAALPVLVAVAPVAPVAA